MRVRIPALAAVLLLAGCLSPTPEYAREQALAAPAATERALGLDGAARAQVVTLDLVAEGLRIAVEAETLYHRGDAWTTTLRYLALGNLTDASQARIAIACTPERIVVRVSGGQALGLVDSDTETPNTTGSCRPAADQRAAFQQDTQRALGDNPHLARELSLAGGQGFPSLTLKTAEWQRDGSIRATYDATQDGRTLPLEAVVRDARIQRTHAVRAEGDASGEATVMYVYGARDDAPGWRGAKTV